MEIAYRELYNSVVLAKAYAEEQDKIPEIIRSHCSDLVEDIAALAKCQNSYGDKAGECQELIAEAKRVKRDMEKIAFLLETTQKKQAQQQSMSQQQATSPVAQRAAASTHYAGAKLPKIKLPVFDGEATTDYRGFIQAFNETISVEPNLSNVRKWLLLRAQLSGRALELVDELPISPETYDTATKILERAYGSTRRAIMKLYQRLQALLKAELETESLRLTNAKIEGILLSLEGLQVNPNGDDFLRAVVMSKYPHEIMHTLKITDETTLQQFRKDITDYVQLRSYTLQEIAVAAKTQSSSFNGGSKGGAGGSKDKLRHSNKSAHSSSGGDAPKSTPPHQVTDLNSNNKKKVRTRLHKCVFCTGEHWSDSCDVVKSIEERKKKVADRCQKCFHEMHPGASCKSWERCYYCQETTHNRAICPKTFGPNGKILLTTIKSGESKQSNAMTKFITIKIATSNATKSRKAMPRALLDTAGGRSLITADLVEQLQLTSTNNRRIRLTGLDDTPIGIATTSRKLFLYPLKGKRIEIEVFVVENIIDDIVATDVAQLKQQYPQYAELPMPPEGNGEKIQLLLGYATLASIVTLQKSISVTSNLHLMSTKFGWVPFGNLPDEENENFARIPTCTFKEADPVKLMADLELVGLADLLKTETDEEIAALEQFYRTIQKVGKNYQIEWPYRYDPPDLQDNFGVAFGRLVHLYKQLKASPEMLQAYDNIIREQVESNIVEVVNTRYKDTETKVHYLPHRGVIRFGKSTPIRMVFDASARKGKGARSLNENILKGGTWVNELPGILLRFRRYEVAVTSDIQKAFHQILIAPKDRDVVRFLWLRNINKPPTPENLITYRFKRMAFGIIASPFLLTATIKYHLKQNPNEFADQILADLYADNLVSSLPKNEELERFYRTTKSCFEDMGMNITKWVTDDDQLRQIFPMEDQAVEHNQNVLGIQWNTKTKLIRINDPKFPPVGLKVTKRVVLQETAKIFDPLGWASPITLMAKLFIRKIWQLDYNWDQPLQLKLVDEWKNLRENLTAVTKIELPRTYALIGIEKAEKIELHAFCDASAEAYGVVIYIVVQLADATWSGIVAAKTRLTPKTQLSIPRLELLAAVTASKYLQYVERELKLIKSSDKYIWSDSRCVISWTSSNKLLPAVVEKAVRIVKASNVQQLLYVPTAENPADVSSRGATFETLQQQQWWRGPSWLPNRVNWPQQRTSPEKEKQLNEEKIADQLQIEEQKILLLKDGVKLKPLVDPTNCDGAPFDLKPNNFSSFGALLRRTAICVKAASRFLRGRGSIAKKTALDYRDAKIRWLRWDQQRIYQLSETNKTNISYLRNLRVIVDENDLIRCKTRLIWAKIPKEEINPILLAKGTELTKLIVLSIHTNNYHAGTAHTLAALRRTYWLPHGRRETYRILKKNCFKCRREDAEPFRLPEMAPLPEFRVNKTETPFTNVGVDTFGPYEVKVVSDERTKVVKYWVIIFTCLIIRAIHLEVLKDMTAEEFLKTFRKFTSRRGVPKLIVCDNAPQFTVVEGIFRCMWRHFATAEVTTRYYAEYLVEWRFVHDYSPWMGAAYERMIKTVKNAFNKVYGSQRLKADDFELAITEIEAVVNSRPITYVDQEQETEIVTPNDFLQLRYPAIPLDTGAPSRATQITDNWIKAEKNLQEFWQIWSEHYLREIRERREAMPNKQKSNAVSPQPGELVLMIDPDQKRSSWKIAVVERLIPSSDGQIRAVQIRAKGRSKMIRPLNRLASLKLFMDLPENMPPLNKQHNAIVVDQQEGFVQLSQ